MALVTSFTCSLSLLCLFLWAVSSEDFVVDNKDALSVSAAEPKPEFEWDPKGYVMFCLCMGELLHIAFRANFAVILSICTYSDHFKSYYDIRA